MMKKSFLTVREMAEIAIFAAIAFALDALQGGIWRGLFPNGGSIGIAMLPVLFLSYRRGFKGGIICATILAFIQMISGVYTLPNVWYLVIIQVALDYVVAYPLVAVAGFFKGLFDKSTSLGAKILWVAVGCVLGGTLKFMSHFIGGFLFWGSNCPEDFIGGPVVFSLVYNGEYMLPNIILNTGIMVLLVAKMPQLFVPNDRTVEVK